MTRTLSIALAGVLVTSAATAVAAGDPAAGKQKAQACASCHGADGNSANPQFPKLAGQYADYMVKALEDYKSGARQNPIMTGFAAALSPQDREDLAAFFASQAGGLYVVKRRQ